MIRLAKALKTWPAPAFKKVLKDEIEQLDATLLPLQRGMSQGSYACNDNISVMILGVSEGSDVIHVKTGIFYTGMIPGCSCADDPTPVNEYTEYCEARFDIDKLTAETTVTLLTGKRNE